MTARAAALNIVAMATLVLAASAGPAYAGSSGETASGSRTEVVSIGPNGAQLTTERVMVSDDGRHVAFAARAAGGPRQVFVRDLVSGETVLASVDGDGERLDEEAFLFDLSRNGRYVVFATESDDVLPGDTNETRDLFRHDVVTGTTVLVNVASDGSFSEAGVYYEGNMSSDGRRVVFVTAAADLVEEFEPDEPNVYVRDVSTGTTVAVSVTPDGQPADGRSANAALSGDGRVVAFTSFGRDVVEPPSQGYLDVFSRDLALGETTYLGAGDSVSHSPDVSRDGRFVVWNTSAEEFDPGDPSPDHDVYLNDATTGTTTWVSEPDAGGPAEKPRHSVGASVSADGSTVVFHSREQLLPDAPPGVWTIYAYDVASSQLREVPSRSTIGPTIGHVAVDISGNGRRVAYVGAEVLDIPDGRGYLTRLRPV